jgi:hypothetical protein
MNRILKTAILSAAVAATTLAAMPANAGDGWRRHRHYDNHSDGDLVAAGILGLAVGALAVGAATASQPEYRVYDDYPRYGRRYYPARRYYPVRREYIVDEGYAGALEPWTPEWYRYCEDRYRSFNPRTGTFRGYDGLNHFCTAG